MRLFTSEEKKQTLMKQRYVRKIGNNVIVAPHKLLAKLNETVQMRFGKVVQKFKRHGEKT